MFEESQNIRLVRLTRVSLCLTFEESQNTRLVRLVRIIRASLCLRRVRTQDL